jgi:thioredoxin-like negative regulator of GroEL
VVPPGVAGSPGRVRRPSDDFGNLFDEASSPPAEPSAIPTARPTSTQTRSITPAAAHAGAAAAIEQGDYERATALFNLILSSSPGDVPARVGVELSIGLRALAQRDRLGSAERFERVLALDPTNERAARELAEMRRKNTTERTGMLSRLLGKERS